MGDTLRLFTGAVLVAGLMSGCAPQVSRPAGGEEQRPSGFPELYYRQAAEHGERVFRIEPDRSLVVIEVRRGGSLAHLGHDHVVASHDVQGFVAPKDGHSDLYVRLDRLVVDEQELRTEAGFETQVSEADIAGTRANMLGRVLHAEEHPFALISVAGVDAASHVSVAITLNGVTRTASVPAEIETGSDELSVAGQLTLDQTDFGITPLSLLGGALQVQDRVTVRFTIRARETALLGLSWARASSNPEPGGRSVPPAG